MYYLIYHTDKNSISISDYLDDLDITITCDNYLEINYLLLSRGNMKQMIFNIKGRLLICRTSIIKELDGDASELDSSIKAFNWIIKHQYKFDGIKIMVPYMDMVIITKCCFYIGDDGGVQQIYLEFCDPDYAKTF